MRCKAQARLVMPRLGPELLQPLCEAGLRPLVLKGLSLIGRYPAGSRPMDDVDLFLPRDERHAAIELLRRLGWSEASAYPHRYSLALIHPGLPGLPLDLHEDVADWEERAFRLRAKDLWEARIPAVVAGNGVYGLRPEWELLVIATHAAKRFHTFDRLLWAVDASVVIRSAAASGKAVDWRLVGTLARTMSARSALAVLLAQAYRLGADSPAWLRQLRGSRTRRLALAPLVSEDWPVAVLDYPTRRRLAYALVENLPLVLRQAVHEIGHTGTLRAPMNAVDMVAQVLTRIWRLHRDQPR
jgi:hypothetical protein